jgi:hypothetical protein
VLGFINIGEIMRIKSYFKFIIILSLLTGCATTDNKTHDKAYAHKMLECAQRHTQFSLVYGIAQLTEKAQIESKVFVDAAVNASSEEFVKQESPIIQKAIYQEISGKLNGSQSPADLEAWMQDQYKLCLAEI